MTAHIPLIAPQSIWNYDPVAYREYIVELKNTYRAEQEQKKALKAQKARKAPSSPVPGITFRYNDLGTPIITIRGRKPKYIAPQEIEALAKHYGIKQNVMWQYVRTKGISVHTPEIQTDLSELPW